MPQSEADLTAPQIEMPQQKTQPDVPQPEIRQLQEQSPEIKPEAPCPAVPPADVWKPEMEQSELPQPEVPQPELPQPELPQPEIPQPLAPSPEQPQPVYNQPTTTACLEKIVRGTLRPAREEKKQTNYIEDLQNPELLKSLEKQEQEAKSRMNPGSLWSRLQRTYSKVLAFDYDHGCEILSIKPQDIGLLPREIWVYGNNSFLLHGYYNYRHLILARLNTSEGGFRYLLGVPGHYYSNEKYMASMFGFPHFVLAKKQPEEDGRIGYWYTDIRL